MEITQRPAPSWQKKIALLNREGISYGYVRLEIPTDYWRPSSRVRNRMMFVGVQSRSQSGQVVGCASGASSKRIASAGHPWQVSQRLPARCASRACL